MKYLSSTFFTNMSERIKKTAASAPPPPKMLENICRWLERNVRKPLEGTAFDKWIATPAKEYYIVAKRVE